MEWKVVFEYQVATFVLNAQIFNSNGTLRSGGGLQQPLVARPRTTQFALKVIW